MQPEHESEVTDAAKECRQIAARLNGILSTDDLSRHERGQIQRAVWKVEHAVDELRLALEGF